MIISLILTAFVLLAPADNLAAKKEKVAHDAYNAVVSVLSGYSVAEGDASISDSRLVGPGSGPKLKGISFIYPGLKEIKVEPFFEWPGGRALPEYDKPFSGEVSNMRIELYNGFPSVCGEWKRSGNEAGEFSIRVVSVNTVVTIVNVGTKQRYSGKYYLNNTVEIAKILENAYKKTLAFDGIEDNPEDFNVKEYSYDDVYIDINDQFLNNYMSFIYSGNYVGVNDDSGKTIIPFGKKFTFIRVIDDNNFIFRNERGRFGVYSVKKGVVVAPLYKDIFYRSEDNIIWSDETILWAESERGLDIIRFSLEPDFKVSSSSSVSCSKCKWIGLGPCYAVYQKGKWGVVNENGYFVTDYLYDDISTDVIVVDTADDDCGFIARKGDRYGIIDSNGSVVVPFVYDCIKSTSDQFIEGFFSMGVLKNGVWYRFNGSEVETEREFKSFDAITDSIWDLIGDYGVEETEYEEDDEVIFFRDAENKPLFMGGDQNEFSKWVANNIIYPESASNISGKVTVQFTVEKDGSITDVIVLRSLDPALDAEAVRVIESSPKWTPGFKNGHPVRVCYTFPVIFQLK